MANARPLQPRTIANVLVVQKLTTYEMDVLIAKDERTIQLLSKGDPAVAHLIPTYEEHQKTLKSVIAELERRSIAYKVATRGEVGETIEGVDLVITVGGDGTFLHCARKTMGVPLVGVNSATASSLGHFCIANRENFATVLDDIIAGKKKCYRIVRLALYKNGVQLPSAVLNEVLISHSCPAGMARYIFRSRGREEFQRTSGIWIGTAAGSTGALRSAGGKYIPCTQRQFEYVVREPAIRPTEDWKLLRGVLQDNETLSIVSQMLEGMLYVDGQYVTYEFKRGDELVVKVHPEDLQAFINPDVNKRYKYYFGLYQPW